MPPKANKGQQQKAKAKIVEDKTFGLKNKNKSAKVQKYVQQVQQAADHQVRRNQAPSQQGPSKKELERKKKEEFNELFKPVQVQQKVPFGVDPKTILCQFFKSGTCTKGKNCKFAHDAGVERKSAKIDLYTDSREEKEADTMDQWDQNKLEEVVQKKHGKGIQTTTDIVCKYFLQAVEERKYGWFWQCPNGDTCKYRHALPPGFVLKEQQKKRKAEDEVVQTLEEWIEEQRRNMPEKLTPVTLESFAKWKEDRRRKKEKEEAEKSKQAEAAVRAGRNMGVSGRDLFTFNPNLFETGDDDEAWEGDYTQREEITEEEQQQLDSVAAANVDMSLFAAEDLENLSVEDLDEEEEE